MSSAFYVGTIEKNKDGIFEVNEPVYITGITMSFVSSLLEESGVDVYNDFTYAAGESIKPTIYSIDNDWDGPISDKYMDCYLEGVPFFNLKKEQYPLICDRKERNGIRIGILEEEIIYSKFENFKEINTGFENVRNIMKHDDYYLNNNSDDMVEDVISTYLKIVDWIKEKRKIYVYLDY